MTKISYEQLEKETLEAIRIVTGKEVSLDNKVMDVVRDSLDAVEVVMELEERLEIEIPDDYLNKYSLPILGKDPATENTIRQFTKDIYKIITQS